MQTTYRESIIIYICWKINSEKTVVLNKLTSILNIISENLDNSTFNINKNLTLKNITLTLGAQNMIINLFEALITLIMQEQHFLSRMKRSFIFSGQVFELMSNIRLQLLKIYVQKDLIFYVIIMYQIFISCRNQSHTLKIVLFIFFKSLFLIASIAPCFKDSISNYNNQTEILTTRWKSTAPSIVLFCNKCITDT